MAGASPARPYSIFKTIIKSFLTHTVDFFSKIVIYRHLYLKANNFEPLRKEFCFKRSISGENISFFSSSKENFDVKSLFAIVSPNSLV